MYNYDYLKGIVCIIVGCFVLIFVVGALLLRLIFTVLALGLINYGLRLQGKPPLFFWFNQFRIFTRFW